jgi:Flp pilus assembly protein TadD
MGRLIWGLGLFVLMVAGFPPAVHADDLQDCQSSDNDVRISGCTAVIDKGVEADRAWAYYTRGLAYKRKGEHDRAIKDFDQATALDPKDAKAYLNRGLSYENKGEKARALSDFDMAILLDPKNAEAYNNRCWLRALQGMDLDAARADCDSAIAIKSEGAYLDSRGLVGIKQGRFAYAWADYDAAVRADPYAATYYYGRGIAALRLGRLADGNADLARAAELDSNIAKIYEGYGVAPDAVNTNIDVSPAPTLRSIQSQLMPTMCAVGRGRCRAWTLTPPAPIATRH